jgi:TolB-like protein
VAIRGCSISFLCAVAGIVWFVRGEALCSEPLDEIAKTISKSSHHLKNKQIAVLPFPYHNGREGEGSTVISEKLITRIAARNRFRVIERSLLEKVLAELKLQSSGAVSQDSAKKIGNILGVEAIVTGTLIDLGGGEIEINARLIQTETGLVLCATSQKDKKTWKDDSPPQNTAASRANSGSERVPGDAASDEELSKKMSLYFNSRDWSNPRLAEPGGTEGTPSPDPTPAPAETTLVMGNAENEPVVRQIDEEHLCDPPASFFDEMRSPDTQTKVRDIAEFQNVWQMIQRRDYDQAAKSLRELRERMSGLERPPYSFLAQLYLAECHFGQGQYDKSLNAARRLARIQDMPKLKAHAIYISARSFEMLGRRRLAQSLYRDIVRNFPFENRLIRSAGYRITAR